MSTDCDERVVAVKLAHRILDRINADPDDELAILARQLLRAIDSDPPYASDHSKLLTTVNLDSTGRPRFATEEERKTCQVDSNGRLILWHGARVLLGSDSSNW